MSPLAHPTSFHQKSGLCAGVVDVCLIPEVPFSLDGEMGLYAYIRKLLENKGHAVICVAEGAGQVISCSSHYRLMI